MSWRDTFGIFRRSSSNYGHNAQGAPPQVSDSDYSYLTNDDIVAPPRTYQQQSHNDGRRVLRPGVNYPAEDESPDILLLKHRGVTYPLHFPAYAIDDGVLTVGAIRRRAAEQTGTSDLNRIKILYKGKLLRDDNKPCKDEGLRQQSEVISLSGSEALSLDSRSTDHRHQSPPSGSGGVKKKGNKKKKKKHDQQHLAPEPRPVETRHSNDNLAPPSDARPTSSGRSSAAPSPSPRLQQFSTPNERVEALLRYLRTELAPLCEKYFSNPPTDPKARDYEHKLLNETILSQVILKADGIDSEEARPARRALIKEAQGLLNKLDALAPQTQ
ncbi:BAG domain protein [Talaromyces stipitatus ATCC 10500]|uniref:BAG domain protein n=1 Tax=Talaromyces stipitatus (strain ATCC 10500 / CBS 375.48 / QM 6759 / NRRL 1006) TaxID=441959 RepID=B8M838_TALSN|nr:BAG domain protein [Talaromyces stipitatus ATCC 10500]EED20000.1 BAG domain protein [Talaromyces stipitatus ATCC 10500]